MISPQSKLVFAIDVGSAHSGFAILESRTKLHRVPGVQTFGKVGNKELLDIIRAWSTKCVFPIEFPYPKNNVVGYEVFLMTAWVGKMQLTVEQAGAEHFKIFRHREKSVLCHTGSATDAQIRMSVIDSMGGKGTKDNPGPTYGVSSDVWQAIAVGITFLAEGDSWERDQIVRAQKAIKAQSTKPKLALPV